MRSATPVRVFPLLVFAAAGGSIALGAGTLPVKGSVGVVLESVDGVPGPAEKLKLEMHNPPAGLHALELKVDPATLHFAADCQSGQLRVHDETSIVDTGWVSLQGGSYEFRLPTPSVDVSDDGAGHRDCSVGMVLHLRGSLDCHNHDAPGISAQIVYELTTDEAFRSRGHVVSCSFPTDSYLYTRF